MRAKEAKETAIPEPNSENGRLSAVDNNSAAFLTSPGGLVILSGAKDMLCAAKSRFFTSFRMTCVLGPFLMTQMRFVQFADVHLDSRIGGALGLSEEKKRALGLDIRESFAKACALAAERKADLALIPGDLFDYETASAATPAFLAEYLGGIAPIPVFITPGNHDSLRPGSPYWGDWPGNVRVFGSSEFESVVIDGIGCSVTGIAHAHRGLTNRLLSSRIERPQAPVNILLFHGSRDGWKPGDKETTLPFSDSELAAQGFHYTAIGHYHSFAEIRDEGGAVLGAYSGCLQGRGLDETGVKFALVGEIGADGRVSIEPVEVAACRIVSVQLDVTGRRDNDAIIGGIESAAASSGARECDIVDIVLTGALAPGLEPDASMWEAPYFHANIRRSGLVPDYDLAALSTESHAESLKSAFVRRMLEIEKECDEAERPIVRDAIYYGLYALDGRKLEPRNED